MLRTLPIGHGPGTGMMSPRNAKCACARCAELSNPARVATPEILSAAALAGITPPLVVIAMTFSPAPSATTGTPARRRFANRK